MSFDWQTEDDQRWEQPDTREEQSTRRRPWFWLILFVGLFGAGLYFGWQQVQERVEDNTEARRDEVRASYRLALRAAQEGDQELFVSMLSGRSATWTEAQKARLDQDLLFAQTARILRFGEGTEQGTPQVQFNPELSEGVLTVAQAMTVDAGSGLTETVVLTQTHVFRQGSQRWLLSPPEAAFWGGWAEASGQVLRLEYPTRDAALVTRLVEDLDRKLLEMCRTLVDCPADFRVNVRLESDPQSVLQTADVEARLTARRELILPSPTLLGLPADEAAYAALFRGYAAHIVSSALVERLDYDCCELVTFQDALLQWQLSRLGLRSAPIATGDYLSVIDAPLGIDGFWQRSAAFTPGGEAPLEVHAFIDFLRSKLSMRRDPLGALLEGLSQSRSFWGWVASLTSYEPTDPTVLQEDWSAFVWEKAREAQSVAEPLPAEQLPQQDIVAMCGDGDTAMDLYRYSLPSAQWTREIDAGVEFAALQPLPDGDGYIVTGQYPDQDFDAGLVTYLKRGQEAPFTISQAEPPGVALLPWNVRDPQGTRMLVWLLSEQSDGGGLPNVALIDPQTCTPNGCPVQPLPGMPIWSPEGRLGLVLDIAEGKPLYLPEDKTEWQSLGEESAIWPFWLDDETVGYVRQEVMGNRHTLMALDLATDERREIITSDDLADAAGPSHRGESFRISLVRLDPSRPGSLLITAVGASNPPRSHLFTTSLSDEVPALSSASPRLRLLETFAGTVETEFWTGSLASNDRYLLLPVHNYAERTESRTYVYDFQAQEIVLSTVGGLGDYPLSGEGHWSADGRWLVRSLEQSIDIIAPGLTRDEQPFRRLIFHDFDRCQVATWVNR